jgi:hypothetical protein
MGWSKKFEDKFYDLWITENKHHIKYTGKEHDLALYYFRQGILCGGH